MLIIDKLATSNNMVISIWQFSICYCGNNSIVFLSCLKLDICTLIAALLAFKGNKAPIIVLKIQRNETIVAKNRCTWEGSDCNMDVDFQANKTDAGICYTFNFNPDDKKTTKNMGTR